MHGFQEITIAKNKMLLLKSTSWKVDSSESIRQNLTFKKTTVFTNYNHPVTDQCNITFTEWQIVIIHKKDDTNTRAL